MSDINTQDPTQAPEPWIDPDKIVEDDPEDDEPFVEQGDDQPVEQKSYLDLSMAEYNDLSGEEQYAADVELRDKLGVALPEEMNPTDEELAQAREYLDHQDAVCNFPRRYEEFFRSGQSLTLGQYLSGERHSSYGALFAEMAEHASFCDLFIQQNRIGSRLYNAVSVLMTQDEREARQRQTEETLKRIFGNLFSEAVGPNLSEEHRGHGCSQDPEKAELVNPLDMQGPADVTIVQNRDETDESPTPAA